MQLVSCHSFNVSVPFCSMSLFSKKQAVLRTLQSFGGPWDILTVYIFFFFLLCRTCKYPEGQNANLEKIPWNTSATVAFVGSCPKCPQGVYLTSSSMEPQGSVPHLSQSPEASCEFMENPRGWVSCLIILPLGFNFVAFLGA